MSAAPSGNPRSTIGLFIGVLLGLSLLAGAVFLLKPWQWMSPAASLPSPGSPTPDLAPAASATQGEQAAKAGTALAAISTPMTASSAQAAQPTESPSSQSTRLLDLSKAVFSPDDLGQGFESIALDRMGVPKTGTIDPGSGLPVGGSFVLQHQTSKEMLLGLVLLVTDPTTETDFDTALAPANFENSQFAKNYLQGLNLKEMTKLPITDLKAIGEAAGGLEVVGVNDSSIRMGFNLLVFRRKEALAILLQAHKLNEASRFLITDAAKLLDLRICEALAASAEVRWITYEKWLKCADGTRFGCQVELWAIRTDGKELHRLTAGSYDVDPAWSPDGLHLAFARNAQNNEGIYLTDLQGSAPTRLSANKRAYGPIWFFNDVLVFASRRGPEQDPAMQWRLVAIEADGSDESVANTAGVPAFAPVIAPNRRAVAFQGPDEQVYVYREDGTEPLTLSTGPVKGMPLYWRQDTREIVVSTESDCLAIKADGSGSRRLADGCSVTWTPDFKRAVYAEDNSIWLADRGMTNKRVLVKGDATVMLSNPVWGPPAVP